ncbi:MAG: hypothetical protein KAX37_03865 [Opitutaceae bacterium]|nr:hypothetical protein [Opitutaceae bacterium]
MTRVTIIALSLCFALFSFSACTTAPRTAEQPRPVVGAAPESPSASLADQIQESITAIDQTLLRYDALLTTVERLPEGKPAEKIFEEIGSYIGSDFFEYEKEPTSEEMLAEIAKTFSFPTQVVMIESGVQADLVSLSERIVNLNTRTADLASRFDRGQTVREYARRVRRELMPLMAQIRSMARADNSDREGIAKLEAETNKIIGSSRQSLMALERETRSIESELGAKP